MRLRPFALLLACVALPAAAQPSAVPPPPPLPATLDDLYPQLDAGFARFAADQHIPGLAWGMVRDGRLAHLALNGVQDIASRRPVAADTRFRIASMSKAFTALAILKLRDDGRLRLDDLAEQYVPQMRGWTYPTSDAPRIRIRDLLSHVGGFVTDDPWGDRQQVLSPGEFNAILAAGVPFTRAPQTQFEYSNLGYALLGRIITNASGRPYQRYIADEIMRPLGMADTTYDVTAVPRDKLAIGYRWEDGRWSEEPAMRDGEFGAMGGVVTTANDYARWVAFLLAAWPARDGPEEGPVRRATVRELAQGLNFVSQVPAGTDGGGASCRMAAAYGKGFIVGQSCGLGTVLMHGGGYPGYGSYVMLYPERRVALFAFANRTYAAPASPMMTASERIRDAGLAPAPTMPVSPALASAVSAAGAIFNAGTIEPARSMLAVNFLMDRSPESWARTLAELKTQIGTCRVDAPIAVRATGALSGTFEWHCGLGQLNGQVLLAPTPTPQIQALRFRAAPAAAAGGHP